MLYPFVGESEHQLQWASLAASRPAVDQQLRARTGVD
jgi:hypothetical protein